MRRFWSCTFAALAVASFLPAFASSPAEPITVPRFVHPGAGQVCYFLLTDRFANGSPANDTGGIAGGPEQHGFDPSRIYFYHGGDFAGATAKLDYLRDLGVSAVWVTPPFRNKPVQAGSAGYHGYWILDFLHVDPHLGTDDDFRAFVRAAHARGLKVFLDIIANHTADVIQYADGKTNYIPEAEAPYRDARGTPFDERNVAYNGLNDATAFPPLAADRSFAHVPVVPPAEVAAKNPAWLNDPLNYHNRGNTSFKGENSVHGDFVGLDDLFTEKPEVVRGFIEIYRHWLTDFDVDGFRIDTVKHVNLEFWEAFTAAIREAARQAGKPGFLQFGEVLDSAHLPFVSEFSTTGGLDTTLDFPFMAGVIDYVAQGGPAAGLATLFAEDDHYLGPGHSPHTMTTFLGNHDLGRFGNKVLELNPSATAAQQADLVRLGHGLLLLARGQPVIYYGDEQGMVGRGGGDTKAREDMFAAQAPEYRQATLLATTRTGADDKFDEQHPFFRLIHDLALLRRSSIALTRGAQLVRPTDSPAVFAFSRIDREEKVEYLCVFNNSRTDTVTAALPTSQPAGARFDRVFSSAAASAATTDGLATGDDGRVRVTLPPLQFAVWRARWPLTGPVGAPTIALASPGDGAQLAFPVEEIDGHRLPVRQEIRAEVGGGDGFAEVTFTLARSSRPDQVEFLGTDDSAPYRIFWRPPPDLAPGEVLTFTATVDDLRGHRSASRVTGVTVAPGTPGFGRRGAVTPTFTKLPAPVSTVDGGTALQLAVEATGTGPLDYQWLRDGVEIPGVTGPVLNLARTGAAQAGRYRVVVRGDAGATISREFTVVVPEATAGRIETWPSFASRLVPARQVDIWLPPGYDAPGAGRFPVIYMHDGQNIFDSLQSFGGESWEVDRAMVRLMKAGKTRGAIVVGIRNLGMGRTLEYMPRKALRTDRWQLFANSPSLPAAEVTSDAYLQFIVTELKPAVDRAYRTLPDAAHTSVMGSSMGGLISAYAIAEHPDVFGRAACVSIHWPAAEGAMVDYLAGHLPDPHSHRLYFDHGTETLDALYAPFQERMDAILRRSGYQEGANWMTRVFPGTEHSEKAWRQRVELPLEFLLGP